MDLNRLAARVEKNKLHKLHQKHRKPRTKVRQHESHFTTQNSPRLMCCTFFGVV